MAITPKVYFSSNVFSPSEMGSNSKIDQDSREKIKSLWRRLNDLAEVKMFEGRFPKKTELQKNIQEFNPDIIGCHLSHNISSDILMNSNIFAVCTATVGYNHIQKTEKDDIIITHTPGVLHKTVADYTIALIMANLRNIIDLHNYVWNGKWSSMDRWDLDQNLTSTISNKIIGIVGLGEIGKEVARRLYNWNLRIIYYDINRMDEFEKSYPNIEFKDKLEDIFREADIITLHIPLNKYTEKIINKNLLKLMKRDALLVNTSRGQVLDFNALLDLLEEGEIKVNFSVDVFPIEPIEPETLSRIKNVKELHPELRILVMPHNASADAKTRAKMLIMFLEDIISILESKSINDFKKVHLIPEQKSKISKKDWRIYSYWNRMRED
ncbi:MAG: 2-hydroxyacid dehydrogenase [Candidatus Heimdallarchaeota archaeon]